ncbi:MAG: hypothetical protein JXR29_05750 [Methylothermaceae bacterium]|nr:hypothetical protein [Methylothermaceae bacterium]
MYRLVFGIWPCAATRKSCFMKHHGGIFFAVANTEVSVALFDRIFVIGWGGPSYARNF